MSRSVPEVAITSRISVVRADARHIIEIAPRMRAQDVAEIWAASRRTPVEALMLSMENSELAFTGLIDGRAEAMFGIHTVSLSTGLGSPWFLGTDEILKHSRPFLRASREWLDMLLPRYTELRNYVHDQNTISKRWLEWLGFSLTEPMIMGYSGEKFRMFSLKGEDRHV